MFYEFTLTTGEVRFMNLDEISTVAPLENQNSDVVLTNGMMYSVCMEYTTVKNLLNRIIVTKEV